MVPIPTLNQLYTEVRTDLESEYGSTIAFFGKVFLRAVAAVQAAKLKIYYLVIADVQKNMAPDLADPEASGGTLERYGRIQLGRDPYPAKSGQYKIQVTGSIGATIQSQTTFKSNDDSVNPGRLFVLDVSYVLVATTDFILVRALDAGLDAKMFVGEGLTATIPIPLVNKAAVVLEETIQPLSSETIEDYRQKVIDAYTLEAEGGAATDYRLWASDAQGVQKVYPYAKSGATAEMNIYVEATVADSVDGKGTPSALMLQQVYDVIDFDPDTTRPLNERGRRPMDVIVNPLPIVPLNVDIVVNGFTGITNDQKTGITNALKLFINKIRPFVAAAEPLANKNDVLDLNRIISVILNTYPGGLFNSVSLSVGGVPWTSYTFINGNIPYVNSITFV